jgi:hypothetical protein
MQTTILPSGSALLYSNNNSSNKIISRLHGLGHLARCCRHDDVIKNKILYLLQPKELSNLSLCSKALYVLTTVDIDVWKDLVLNLSEIEWQQHIEPNLIQLYGKSNNNSYFHWKSTYTGIPICHNLSLGVYFSDSLFTSTRCRLIDLQQQQYQIEWNLSPPATLTSDVNINRISHTSLLSMDEFIQQYEIPRKPVIIHDPISYETGMKRWQSGISQAISSITSANNKIPQFRVGPRDMNIQSFASYCTALQKMNNTGDESPLYESPLYVFDSHFIEKIPILGTDYKVPKYFLNSSLHPHRDLFELLGEERRPDYRWIICGAAKTGSKWHIDPNKTHAWNACLLGIKKWLMLPSGSEPPPGVSPSPDGGSVIQPVSLVEWFVEFYEITKSTRKDLIECIQQPGDVVFVPSGTWHAVLNITESCAVTQNYVSDTNAFLSYQFFKDKPEQISGLQDCEDCGMMMMTGSTTTTITKRKATFWKEFENILPVSVQQHIQELEKIRIERHQGITKWQDVKKDHVTNNNTSAPIIPTTTSSTFRFNFFE